MPLHAILSRALLTREAMRGLHRATDAERAGHRRVQQPRRRSCSTWGTPPQAAGSAPAFSVVILYERLAYVGRAMATYLHLMRELAGDFAPDFRLWRIDIALAPQFAAEAERDIASAEVIIMAVNGREPCPPAFQRWQGGAGQDGGRPPHAIIALMDASDEPVPLAGSWSSVLRRAATQIHAEVFVCDPPAPA